MNYQGDISKKVDSSFATVDVIEQSDRYIASIVVGGNEVIKFPIVKTADVNEISLRISNVVHQTGFIDGPVTVTLNPV